jgi:hypothetical protein
MGGVMVASTRFRRLLQFNTGKPQLQRVGLREQGHIGMGSPPKMERGLNDLWARGGFVYAPPLR